MGWVENCASAAWRINYPGRGREVKQMKEKSREHWEERALLVKKMLVIPPPPQRLKSTEAR